MMENNIITLFLNTYYCYYDWYSLHSCTQQITAVLWNGAIMIDTMYFQAPRQLTLFKGMGPLLIIYHLHSTAQRNTSSFVGCFLNPAKTVYKSVLMGYNVEGGRGYIIKTPIDGGMPETFVFNCDVFHRYDVYLCELSLIWSSIKYMNFMMEWITKLRCRYGGYNHHANWMTTLYTDREKC